MPEESRGQLVPLNPTFDIPVPPEPTEVLRPENDVFRPSAEYEEDAERRRLQRDLMMGSAHMRSQKGLYLSQEDGEDDADYQSRLDRVYLFNGFKRAVRTLSGKPFTRPMKRSAEMPEAITTFLGDVDQQGTKVEDFARQWFMEAMIDGIAFLYVDFPQVFDATRPAGTVLLRDLEERSLKPYWQVVCANDVIGWRIDRSGAAPSLSQVRIREWHDLPVGLYGTASVERIRLLTPGQWELWEKDETGRRNVLVDFGAYGLPYIPLIPLNLNRLDYMRALPVMDELADLNLAHYQSTADQRHILHIVRVPILFGSGIPDDDDEIKIAPNTALITNAPNATLGWLEHKGDSIGAGDKDLENLRVQMAEAALDMLIPKTGGISATAAALNAGESISEMQANAIALNNALNRALKVTWDWLPQELKDGAADPGTLQAYTDFAFSLRDIQEMQLLFNTRGARDIARKYYIAALDRRGMLGPDFDPEDNETLLAAEREEEARMAMEVEAAAFEAKMDAKVDQVEATKATGRPLEG